MVVVVGVIVGTGNSDVLVDAAGAAAVIAVVKIFDTNVSF